MRIAGTSFYVFVSVSPWLAACPADPPAVESTATTTGDGTGTGADVTSSGAGTGDGSTTASPTASTVEPTSGGGPTGTSSSGDPPVDPTTTSTTAEPPDPDLDPDGDFQKDPYDNCPTVPNPSQLDTDGDGEGNACDDDDDGDGVPDADDSCPLHPAPQNSPDTDNDGQPDLCDVDDDDDGVLDSGDNCPKVANPEQASHDQDKFGDACDDDDDDDGLPDAYDNCPLVSNTEQADLDNDKLGDACDDDADGDGYDNTIDPSDAHPECPGKPLVGKIYANTQNSVYVVDQDTYAVTKFPDVANPLMDVAIDHRGFVYGLVSNYPGSKLACIGRDTGKLVNLTSNQLATDHRTGFGAYPPGVIVPDGMTFAVLTDPHLWWANNAPPPLPVFVIDFNKSLSGNYLSGGDIVYHPQFGTLATVTKFNPTVTNLARIDMNNGNVSQLIVNLQGYSQYFGLAVVDGIVVAFGSDGEILEIDPATQQITFITDTDIPWLGAAAALP